MKNKSKFKLDTKISFHGKVIEILEKKGQITAKVSCSPAYITILIDRIPKIRLNDLLIIDGKIMIDNISYELHQDKIFNIEMN